MNQHSIRLIITTLTVPARSFALFLVLTLFSITFKAQPSKMLMRLAADGNLMQNETVVYFDSSATYDYDPLYDAPSLGTNEGYLNIVTRTNSIDYEVNAVPAIGQNMIIPVKITTGTSGLYSVYANELNNLPQGASVILHDIHTNQDFDLRTGATQYFISDTETVARFLLKVSVNMIQNVSLAGTDPTCSSSANGCILATAWGAGPFNYYWKDSLNNLIRVALNKGTTDSLPGANAGAYRLDVTTPGTNNNATVYLTLAGAMSSKADFQVLSNNIHLYNGIANLHFTNTSLSAQSYVWSFGDGMGSIFSDPNHSYNQVGSYTVTLNATNSICGDVSVHQEIITVDASMGLETKEASGISVEADANGYYVNTNGRCGTLCVNDLLGRELSRETLLKNGEKRYLDPSLPGNEVLIIQIYSDNGRGCIKFIKQ